MLYFQCTKYCTLDNDGRRIRIQTINKQQFLCSRIARELLVMHIEGKNRLRPVKQYVEEYGVGTGTVQGAFQALKDAGAIELNACGAGGTYIASVDQRKLFDACGYGELIGLMPLDEDMRMRGLATGIYEAVSEWKLPIHILFARGSKNRIHMVKREKCDFTVMSRLAYETAIEIGEKSISMVGEIGEYPGVFGCITRRDVPFDRERTKVAFDRYSYDQLGLHRALGFQKDPLDDCLDVQLTELVRRGVVEAALCHCQSVGDDLRCHPLSDLPEEMRRKLNQAVLVARKGEDALAQLLRLILRCERVSTIQREVAAGNRMVKY